MKMTITPKICQGEGATYSGTIEVVVPKSVERHNYIRKSGLTAVMDKMEDGKTEQAIGLVGQYELMTNLMGFVEKHISAVDLVRKEDGMKVSTADEFLSIQSCEPAVLELCTMFLKGFEPGKNSGA